MCEYTRRELEKNGFSLSQRIGFGRGYWGPLKRKRWEYDRRGGGSGGMRMAVVGSSVPAGFSIATGRLLNIAPAVAHAPMHAYASAAAARDRRMSPLVAVDIEDADGRRPMARHDLRHRLDSIAAAWAAGRSANDDSRPATITNNDIVDDVVFMMVDDVVSMAVFGRLAVESVVEPVVHVPTRHMILATRLAGAGANTVAELVLSDAAFQMRYQRDRIVDRHVPQCISLIADDLLPFDVAGGYQMRYERDQILCAAAHYLRAQVREQMATGPTARDVQAMQDLQDVAEEHWGPVPPVEVGAPQWAMLSLHSQLELHELGWRECCWPGFCAGLLDGLCPVRHVHENAPQVFSSDSEEDDPGGPSK